MEEKKKRKKKAPNPEGNRNKMKENADIDQSKTSFRNPDWILILGVEPLLECELVNVLLLGSALEILGCPGNWTDFFLSFFFFFTATAVFVFK